MFEIYHDIYLYISSGNICSIWQMFILIENIKTQCYKILYNKLWSEYSDLSIQLFFLCNFRNRAQCFPFQNVLLLFWFIILKVICQKSNFPFLCISHHIFYTWFTLTSKNAFMSIKCKLCCISGFTINPLQNKIKPSWKFEKSSKNDQK